MAPTPAQTGEIDGLLLLDREFDRPNFDGRVLPRVRKAAIGKHEDASDHEHDGDDFAQVHRTGDGAWSCEGRYTIGFSFISTRHLRLPVRHHRRSPETEHCIGGSG